MSKRKSILQQIPIEYLCPGKYQPRQDFAPEKLQELVDSIKSAGLIQPIIVRPIAENRYEIVAGERRWRAAQLAGLSVVNCLVCNYNDEQALQAAIIENINRTDLNPIEEASAYQRLIDEFHYLHEEIAASVGKSRAAVTNSLRLLKLAPTVQQLLVSGALTEGHGKILASLSIEHQIELAQACVKKGWNVRKMELEAKRLQCVTPDISPYSDVNLQKIEVALSEYMGNRVHFECEAQGGGYVRIRFNNVDELEGHFQRFGFKFED